MFSETDLIPISALQHFAFCERQCALIHIEKLWAENIFTAEGRVLHEKAHGSTTDFRDGVLTTRSIPLRSLEYGLSGIADVVEFHSCPDSIEGCTPVPGHSGLWKPFPVEYKRGRAKTGPIDAIQLCAQAFCLEEMLTVKISDGALFYGKARRRSHIIFSEDLRSQTIECISKTHRLIKEGITPEAEYSNKCERCSLKDLCLPNLKKTRRSYSNYMIDFFKEEI